MKREKKLLALFTLVVLIVSLLLSSVPVSAFGPDAVDRGALLEVRTAMEWSLQHLAGNGFVGIAHCETDGEVIVFVEDEQAKRTMPESFEGYPVRVEVTGTIEVLSDGSVESATAVAQNRRGEVRPLMGGTSISTCVPEESGVPRYAGTLGMVTYDDRILSNAHVIAMKPGTGEFLDTGTPVIQPGSRDGGALGDRVGELEYYIPIDFGPDAENYADAAIASIDDGIGASPGGQFDEEGSYWIQGWTEVSEGDSVRKSGRSTGVTAGEVVHANASVWVRYGEESAYFVDQILVAQEDWSFSARGDSGSAVDKGGEFVGLVFAGSDTLTVVSKAEHIIAGLGIELDLSEGRCSLTVSSSEGGSVAVPGEGMFVYDAEHVVELVAEAEEHYRFIEWVGDVDEIDDVYDARTDVVMRGNYSITATFELAEGWHSLTTSGTGGGSVVDPGEATLILAAETVVDLVAEAEEHYRFVQWSGCVDAIGDVYAAATNITMNNSCSAIANFELKEGLSSLTVASAEGGSVLSPGEAMHIYEVGEEVPLIAQADEDYRFVKWIGDVDAMDDVYSATTTITMDGSHSIAATFEAWHPDPLVQLTVSSTGGGSVTGAGEGVFFFTLGTEVGLVAEPDQGYSFIGWSGDVDALSDASIAVTTVTMANSYAVKANFESVGGGCFIATAAYGTPMAEEIQILREFRDGHLRTNPLGSAFVHFYYAVSPPIAEFISEYAVLKLIVRITLVPAVVMSTFVVNAGLPEKMAVLGVVGLVLSAVAMRAAADYVYDRARSK